MNAVKSIMLNRRLPVVIVFVGRRMTPAFQLAGSAADQHVRHVVVQVLVRVAHVRAVEHERVIEQRAVAIR